MTKEAGAGEAGVTSWVHSKKPLADQAPRAWDDIDALAGDLLQHRSRLVVVPDGLAGVRRCRRCSTGGTARQLHAHDGR
jgi:hypothetical protein